MSDAVLHAYYTPYQGFIGGVIVFSRVICSTDGGTATAGKWNPGSVSSKADHYSEEDDNGAEYDAVDDGYA